jgi:hypothetical protein
LRAVTPYSAIATGAKQGKIKLDNHAPVEHHRKDENVQSLWKTRNGAQATQEENIDRTFSG